MKSLLVVSMLVAAVFAATEPTNPDDSDHPIFEGINGILQNVIDYVNIAIGKLGGFTADTAPAIVEFVENTQYAILSTIEKTTRELEEAEAVSIVTGIKARAQATALAIKDFTKTMRLNAATLVKKLRAIGTYRSEPSIDPTLFTQALNQHLFLIGKAAQDNNGKLYGVYNMLSKQGLISSVLVTLADCRMNLLNELDEIVSQLCEIKNDNFGALTGSKDSAIAALSTVRDTAKSASTDCNGLGCLLLYPKALQIAQRCNC